MTTISFEAIHNFRDMGGLTTQDSRKVKHGLLFRSGHLANATAEDLKMLHHLQIKTIFDYRDEIEIVHAPTPQLEQIKLINVPAIKEDCPIKIGSLQTLFFERSIEQLIEDFSEFYTSMSFHNPSFQQLMRVLAEGDGALLHHCTAGKDRTGVGAALIYLLLGVDEAQITNEFLLTNDLNKQHTPTWATAFIEEHGEDGRLHLLHGVYAQLIEAVFKAILEKYGTYDAYFFHEYGFDSKQVEAIRAKYLEN
jgi:protein-tyrosine phosphatase